MALLGFINYEQLNILNIHSVLRFDKKLRSSYYVGTPCFPDFWVLAQVLLTKHFLTDVIEIKIKIIYLLLFLYYHLIPRI